MPARLVLVRHGRSAHRHDGSWIDRAGAERFSVLYDAAGIRDDSRPPAELMALAARADRVMASDMRRAIESAAVLSPGGSAEISPLLRELDFDLPAWGPRLPINTWDVLFNSRWSARMWLGVDHPEMRRAVEASDWLETRSSSNSLGVVVTHGGFRRLMTHQLRRRGWTLAGTWHPFHNWSAWELTR